MYSSLYVHAAFPYLNLSSCFTGIEVDSFLSVMVLPLLLPDARSKADVNKVIYFTEVNLNEEVKFKILTTRTHNDSLRGTARWSLLRGVRRILGDTRAV